MELRLFNRAMEAANKAEAIIKAETERRVHNVIDDIIGTVEGNVAEAIHDRYCTAENMQCLFSVLEDGRLENVVRRAVVANENAHVHFENEAQARLFYILICGFERKIDHQEVYFVIR